MDPVERFGRNLKQARKARGWTQEELAERAGLPAVQVSRVERGVRDIRLTTLARILDALDCDPRELFAGLVKHQPSSPSSDEQVSRRDA